MRRSDSVDFFFQLTSLVVALIIVHAFYVSVVRPNAVQVFETWSGVLSQVSEKDPFGAAAGQ